MNISIRRQNIMQNVMNMHGKNDFAEISKNSARYRSENSFI